MKFFEAFQDEISKIANDDEESESKGKKPSEDAVLGFFQKNKNPSDEEFHEWAESNGYNVHRAEEVAYGVISEMMHGGRSKGKMPEGVSPEDVETGMEVEKEHVKNPILRKKIMADHLTELKDYYDKKEGLPALEKALEKKAAKMTKCPATGKLVSAEGRGMHMRSAVKKLMESR